MNIDASISTIQRHVIARTLVVLVPLAALVIGFIIAPLYQAVIQQHKIEFHTHALEQARAIEHEVKHYRDISEQIASCPLVLEKLTALQGSAFSSARIDNQVHSNLSHLLEINPSLKGISVFDLQGQPVTSVGITAPPALIETPPSLPQQAMVLDAIRIDDQQFVPVLTPVRDRDDTIIGFDHILFSTESLHSAANQFSFNQESSQFIVVQPSIDGDTPLFAMDTQFRARSLQTVLDDFFRQPPPETTYVHPQLPDHTITPLAIKNTPWIALAAIPNHVLHGFTYDLSIHLILTGLAWLLLSMAGLFYATRPITHQLKDAIHAHTQTSSDLQFERDNLQLAKLQLQRDVEKRERVEHKIRRLNEELESKVQQRTEQLIEDVENAKALAQCKSQFLANMSHEMRTPMNAIVAMTHLFADEPLTDQGRHLLKRLRSSGTLLQRTINDLLDFSKNEDNKIELERTPIHLVDLLDHLAYIMTITGDNPRVELIIDPPDPGCLDFLGDGMRIEQVMVNLTSNAIKFTHAGHITLKVERTHETASHMTLRFSVEDTGIGIASSKLDDIFNPFAQADASTTRDYGGTGLGLSISQQLVALMGGDLQVESTEGKGSRFYFSLTLEKVPNSSHLPPPHQQAEHIADSRAIACRRQRTRADERIKIRDSVERGRQHPCNSSGIRYTTPYYLVIVTSHKQTAHCVARSAHLLGWATTVFTDVNAAVEHLSNPNVLSPNGILMDWDLGDVSTLTLNQQLDPLTHLKHSERIIMSTENVRAIKKLLPSNQIQLSHRFLEKPITPSMLREVTGPSVTPEETLPLAQRTMPLTGVHLLVVDDNETNREAASLIFSREGATVHLCCNGRQAIEWLTTTSNTAHAILMDIQMPTMNGIEATAYIRQKLAIDLPIIALTADNSSNQQQLAYEVGIDDWIEKPMDIHSAIACVIRWTVDYAGNTAAPPGSDPSPQPEPIAPKKTNALLDIAHGLLIWGDESTYMRWLRRFNAQYTLEQWRSLHNQPSETTYRAVHKLKGAAGNLGLTALAQTSASVLATAPDDEAAFHNTFGKLLITLRDTHNSIQHYTQILSVSNTADTAIEPNATSHNQDQALGELLEALDTDNPDVIEPTLSRLNHQLNRTFVTEFTQLVEGFEFVKARTMLERERDKKQSL